MRTREGLGFILAVVILWAAAGLLPPHASAESRGRPMDPDQLLGTAAEVFVGEVLEVRTFDRHGRTVPVRARVLLGIKGFGGAAARTAGERQVLPKDPGRATYFDEEFDQAAAGQVGVFYVGDGSRGGLLLGDRRIPSDGQGRPATAPRDERHRRGAGGD